MALSLLAVFLAGCSVGGFGSSTPTPTPAPAPSPTPTSVPNASQAVTAVQAIVCWGSSPNNIGGCPPHSTASPGPCYQGNPSWSPAAGCPITARLEGRLRHNPTSGPGGGADPICRCQNVPTDLAFKVPVKTATRDVVDVIWNFGGPSTTGSSKNPSIDFVVVDRKGSWLVDDSYCAGYPSTSIYDTPVEPCG